MFNTTVVYRESVRDNYPQTIHEHRAPTAESAKFLNELTKEAENKVLKSAKLDNNLINVTVHEMRSNLWNTDEIKLILSINGKVQQIECSLDIDKSRHDKLEEIYKALAHNIAASLMNECAEKLSNSKF